MSFVYLFSDEVPFVYLFMNYLQLVASPMKILCIKILVRSTINPVFRQIFHLIIYVELKGLRIRGYPEGERIKHLNVVDFSFSCYAVNVEVR